MPEKALAILSAGECSRILYVRGVHTPSNRSSVSRTGYFNRTRTWPEYLERRCVLPNCPQCRLLLIELSIPVPSLSPQGILDFPRISMRDASYRGRRRRRGLLSHSSELRRASCFGRVALSNDSPESCRV